MKAKTLWAWTIGLILLTLALGCVAVSGSAADQPGDTLVVELGAVGHTAWFRAVDYEAGVVCWFARNHVYGGSAVAIDCIPIDQTLLLETAQ